MIKHCTALCILGYYVWCNLCDCQVKMRQPFDVSQYTSNDDTEGHRNCDKHREKVAAQRQRDHTEELAASRAAEDRVAVILTKSKDDWSQGSLFAMGYMQTKTKCEGGKTSP